MANATGMMMGLALGQAVLQMLAGSRGGRGGMMMGGPFGAGMQAGSSLAASFFGKGGRQGGRQTAMPQMPDLSKISLPKPPSLANPVTAQTEPFVLASKLPGRRRYRAALLLPEFADMLQDKFRQLAFLKDCQVNAATGSLLFLYDRTEEAEAEMDKLATFLRERIFRLPPKQPGAFSGKGHLEYHAGLLTKSLRGTMRDFSHWLKAQTGGMLDASSAASLFFMLRGLWKMFSTKQYPSGAQMFWWAVSLLRGWKTL